MAGRKGRSGRRPDPLALHVIRGTYRADRQKGRHTGQAPPGRPEPGDLGGEALAEWGRLVEAMAKLGTLSPADGPALRLYAQLAASTVALEGRKAALAADALAVRALLEKGRSPVALSARLVELRQEAGRLEQMEGTRRAALGRMLVELNLTPSTRGRVAPTAPEGDDGGQDTKALSPLAKLRAAHKRPRA